MLQAALARTSRGAQHTFFAATARSQTPIPICILWDQGEFHVYPVFQEPGTDDWTAISFGTGLNRLTGDRCIEVYARQAPVAREIAVTFELPEDEFRARLPYVAAVIKHYNGNYRLFGPNCRTATFEVLVAGFGFDGGRVETAMHKAGLHAGVPRLDFFTGRYVRRAPLLEFATTALREPVTMIAYLCATMLAPAFTFTFRTAYRRRRSQSGAQSVLSEWLRDVEDQIPME